MGRHVGKPCSQQEIPHETKLYFDIQSNQWPIIYHPEYNVRFLGLEKLHPFDAGKWGNIFQFLKDANMVDENTAVQPLEAEAADLQVVHTKRYLRSLKWSWNVAMIAEIPPLAFLPNVVVQCTYLSRMRKQVGGTILAGKLALEQGWAINIGGGFHHSSGNKGGGFCAYADISLAIQFLFDKVERVRTAMIVDLDAHQGNGHERDFMNNSNVYIFDVFNKGIYPKDHEAKQAIRRKVELLHFTGDDEYLRKVEIHLEGALNEFRPDIVVYNAGTDILEGDPLGMLSVTSQGIISRDEIVFRKARQRSIPIMMVTSGGYQKRTARIIADSILNLWKQGLISKPK